MDVKQKLADLVKGGAASVGSALLGKGTARDATAASQMAYKEYYVQSASNGEQPMPYEEWINAQNTNRLIPLIK